MPNLILALGASCRMGWSIGHWALPANLQRRSGARTGQNLTMTELVGKLMIVTQPEALMHLLALGGTMQGAS